VGWIDWNHDNDFLDDGEFVVSQAVTTDPAVPIILNIPVGTITAASESWLSRFRLFPAAPAFPVFSYVGEGTNGEVEDHLFQKNVGASIGDIVWINTNGNSVIDGSELGLGGVLVELRDSGGINVISSQTTSD
jgi:hypothetical protein